MAELKELLVYLSEDGLGEKARDGINAVCTAHFLGGAVIEFTEFIDYETLNVRDGNYSEMLKARARELYEHEQQSSDSDAVGAPDNGQAVGLAQF